MIVRYWHPFQEVETLRRQLDQVFNEVGNAVENAPTTWTPAVRLVETENAYALTVQLAGIDPDAIDIQVTREAVSIAGNRTQPEVADGDRVLYDGIRYGAFRRVVPLPEAVQNDAVEANFDNGLLTLTLPKVEEVRNKVVKINLGQNNLAQAPIAEATE
ncbi:MAG: Hsp20/alpha crystallin family protein [Leptolyngbyaceae cyanobacterium]